MNKKFISIGFQCAVPEVLTTIGVKSETLPFDWMLSNPKFVYTMLDLLLNENLDIQLLVKEHFFKCNHMVKFIRPEEFFEIESGPDFYNKKYDVIFPHDKDLQKDIEKYCRRFIRLKELIYNLNIIPIFLYISPSSRDAGNFKINEKFIISDSVNYFNKIFELISKIRTDFQMIIIDSTSIDNLELLNNEIKYEIITPKNYYPYIKTECINILNKYK